MTEQERKAFEQGLLTGYAFKGISRGIFQVPPPPLLTDRLVVTFNVTDNTVEFNPFYVNTSYYEGANATSVHIDWGDGAVATYPAHSYTELDAIKHLYVTPGLKTITFIFTELRSLMRMFASKPVVSVEGAFNGCVPTLTSAYCSFYVCTQLTTVSPQLFINCPNITDFGNVFQATSLQNIPEDLFKYNTKATNFTLAFKSAKCPTIPATLFANCTNVTSVQECFGKASITSIPSTLFDNCQKSIDFSYCFYGCSLVTGAAPELWKRTNVTRRAQCFNGCTRLSNYASIPNDWKLY